MMKRKCPMQTDRKKKVSLPAALFNRSPLKNVQNSSMISNTSFSNQPTCQNHANKKGKYIVVSQQIQQDELTYYCQKCAILLASKGFEVKKLESNEPKPIQKRKSNPRQQQLINFVKMVQQKTSILKQNRRLASDQLAQIQDLQQDKIRRVQQFFLQIYNTLQKHKKNQIHEISLKKKNTQQQLTTYLGYTNEKIQLLQTMKQDIESSHDSIVHQTPQADYQLVMSHYQANISQIKLQPITTTFSQFNLPPVDSIECVLAQFFDGARPGPQFSFDSSKKGYSE